jgi:prevent-host-death family protein
VAVLKQHLSGYLHRVEAGEEFVVTAHRRPVARVSPPADRSNIRAPMAGMSSLAGLQGVHLSDGPDAVAALMEDRAGR